MRMMRASLKFTLIALGTGLLIHLLCLGIAAAGYMSQADVYGKVRLAMTRDEMLPLLDKEGIVCGFVGPPENARSMCKFSDFWREYTIIVHPTTGRVTRKHFRFKRQAKIMDYVVSARK